MEAPNVLKVETFELWETIKTRYISNTLGRFKNIWSFQTIARYYEIIWWPSEHVVEGPHGFVLNICNPFKTRQLGFALRHFEIAHFGN